MKCDGLTNEFVCKIIKNLLQGYGVEDIAVRGIATEEEARRVIKKLRKYNLIDQLYKSKKEKYQCN